MAEAAGTGRPRNRWQMVAWAAVTLGFALGGFFDGILLHQVLQWHHLLSGLDGGRFQDVRFQVMADGVFHALMYGVALAGLWLLWRARDSLAAAGASRVLVGWTLIGFGAWHAIDAVLSHWLLGIHRIRMGAEYPILWDLTWFLVFGVAFIAVGWRMVRKGNGRQGGGGRRTVAAGLAALVAVSGPLAALPPGDTTTVMVLFRSGITVGEVAAAAVAVDGRLVWSDSSGLVWAIDLDSGVSPLRLYRYGALLVGSGIAAGCFGWSRV